MKYLLLILFFSACSKIEVAPSEKGFEVKQFRKDSIVRVQSVYYNDLRKKKKGGI